MQSFRYRGGRNVDLFSSAFYEFELHERVGRAPKYSFNLTAVGQSCGSNSFNYLRSEHRRPRLLARAATVRATTHLARFIPGYRFGKFWLVSRLAIFSIGRHGTQSA